MSTTLASDVDLFTSDVTVYSYSSQQDKYLDRYKTGLTRYGTSVYREGIAANKYYYPKGTKIYIPSLKRWLTVDDTLPCLGRNTIYVRTLTKRSASRIKPSKQRIHIIIKDKNG